MLFRKYRSKCWKNSKKDWILLCKANRKVVSNMRFIHHPVLCNYYVSYRCNATCSFCDIWEKPSPYVTIDAVTQNLNDLKRLGVKVIDFTGGEPLLHRQ